MDLSHGNPWRCDIIAHIDRNQPPANRILKRFMQARVSLRSKTDPSPWLRRLPRCCFFSGFSGFSCEVIVAPSFILLSPLLAYLEAIGRMNFRYNRLERATFRSEMNASISLHEAFLLMTAVLISICRCL